MKRLQKRAPKPKIVPKLQAVKNRKRTAFPASTPLKTERYAASTIDDIPDLTLDSEDEITTQEINADSTTHDAIDAPPVTMAIKEEHKAAATPSNAAVAETNADAQWL